MGFIPMATFITPASLVIPIDGRPIKEKRMNVNTTQKGMFLRLDISIPPYEIGLGKRE
jgi:hypothetical protein